MTDPRPPKKTDTLEVRMPHDTKRAFLEACRKDGRTASEVVRDFVEGYLSRSTTDQLRSRLWASPPSARSLAMTLLTPKGRRGALAAGVGALGLIALSVSPSAAEIDLRAMYERLDADRDGRVTVEEFATPHTPEGDVLMFSRLDLTQSFEGSAEIEVTEAAQTFWLPAPSSAAAADGGIGREVQIVRRIEGGELITEEIQPVPPETVREMRTREFSMFDENADGGVDYVEFEGRHRAMLENTFGRVDADRSGALSAQELNAIPMILMAGVGAPDVAPPVPPSPYDAEAFAALDRDGDGGVTLEEFVGAGLPAR